MGCHKQFTIATLVYQRVLDAHIYSLIYIFINLSNSCAIVVHESFHAQNACARIENTSLESVVTNVTRNGTVKPWNLWSTNGTTDCQANLPWSLDSRPPPSKRTSYRPSDRLQTSWNWKLSQMLVASDGVAFVRTACQLQPMPKPLKATKHVMNKHT